MLIKQHHSIKIKYMNKQSAALQYFSEGRVWDTRMIRSWVFIEGSGPGEWTDRETRKIITYILGSGTYFIHFKLLSKPALIITKGCYEKW